MTTPTTKHAIADSLAGFASKPLAAAATALFDSLGYKSDKRLLLKPNSAETFAATFAAGKPFNHDRAILADWLSVDFLFQLTDNQVRSAAQGDQQFLFDSSGTWSGAAMESFLFFAITLKKPYYSRTELSAITREVNRLFPMPALLLFRHGDTLTLAVINRRLHKRDESRDVLEKVTLIKDILHKLDPGNVRWKAAKLSTLPQEMREKAETVFREESFDYTRKLELIKDCVHGVDIQPAAIQISNPAGTNRIHIGTLIGYAADRKVPLLQLFGEKNQLIPPF